LSRVEKGILVILKGKLSSGRSKKEGQATGFLLEKNAGVIVDDRVVLSRNPAIRSAAVLFLDICP
jgi:hypothetical protein